MVSRTQWSIGAVLAALALAGCTEQVSGDGKTSEPISPPASSAVNRPDRPQELKVDGVDACKVLTADQQQTLKVSSAREKTNKIAGIADIPMCDFATESAPGFAYSVGLIKSKGIDYLRSGGSNLDINDAKVAGYTALQTNLAGAAKFCSYWVDVADGQMLYVDYIPDDEAPLNEMCQKTQKAAELALQTMKTLR